MSILVSCSLVAFFAGFHVVAGPLYDLYGIRPDFTMLALVTACLVLPPPAAYAAALLAGGVLDTLSPGIVGPHMTGCLLSTFFILRCRSAGIAESARGTALLAIAGILLGLLAPHGARWLLLDGPSTAPGLSIGATTAYTALLTWPVYRITLPILHWALPGEKGIGAIRGRSAWQRHG